VEQKKRKKIGIWLWLRLPRRATIVLAAFFSTLHKASNYLVAPMCATSASLYPLWGFNFLRSLVHNWTLWWPHTLVRVAGDCCTNLL